MRLLPKIHDVYVGKAVLGTVLLTWAVLIGLDLMLAFVGEFGDIGKGDYGFAQAVSYMALSVPRRLHYLFPYAAVIGALMALGQLAATSELTALRAVGLSRRRLSLAVAGALALLTALMVINGETLGPWGQQRADALKAAAKSGNTVVAQYSGLWAREGEVILNAAGGEEREAGDDRWLQLHDVTFYEFGEDGRLKSLAFAKVAEHRPGGWRLREVTRAHFEPRSVRQERVAEERWNSQLDAAALSAGTERPRYLSANALRKAIEYRERNGLDASEFQEHYWGRWFYPLNVLALCLAAVPFAFGTLRSGGLGKRLFVGIVFALGFWQLQTQFVKLATVYKFDYRLAYLLPTVIMLGVSAYLFKRRSG
ncbi:LPS export ABC transporter permease LptG [Vulcaniibacterium tengchongense]|uniref:Lipopolysaccharide export system permease protein n=1 Tax=Vulcaniibacterium tengchongense TaxID=1273429 RepID=A0A3N4VIN6_9GAMM|nr:LPS export ABC transporter permease LptG [Vulcaniibacterium tengchongense]RPE79569.1 lipopolysaccharide export system permease protein [Vulcaniibacterium tengchongense]